MTVKKIARIVVVVAVCLVALHVWLPVPVKQALEGLKVSPYYYGLLSPLSLMVAHVGLAFYVYRDAVRRNTLLLDIPPWLWGFVALGSGIWGLAAYWLSNYLCIDRLQFPPRQDNEMTNRTSESNATSG